MRGPYYKLDEDERAEIHDKLKRRKALLDELGKLTYKALSYDYGCSAEVVRCMDVKMRGK